MKRTLSSKSLLKNYRMSRVKQKAVPRARRERGIPAYLRQSLQPRSGLKEWSDGRFGATTSLTWVTSGRYQFISHDLNVRFRAGIVTSEQRSSGPLFVHAHRVAPLLAELFVAHVVGHRRQSDKEFLGHVTGTAGRQYYFLILPPGDPNYFPQILIAAFASRTSSVRFSISPNICSNAAYGSFSTGS